MKQLIISSSVILLIMVFIIAIPCFEEQNYRETHPGWGKYELNNAFNEISVEIIKDTINYNH